MYVSILPEKKTGKHIMIVRESYRENGKVKQRIIKKLGYAEDYAHLYDDPIAHFKEEYKFKSQQIKEKSSRRVSHETVLSHHLAYRSVLGGLSNITHDVEVNPVFF
jgi:hypothetical protein